MSDWKSTETLQLEELQQIHLILDHLNENILRLCYILTESSISSSSPPVDDLETPAVGFVENSGKVSTSDRCCQTTDDCKTNDRETRSTETQT